MGSTARPRTSSRRWRSRRTSSSSSPSLATTSSTRTWRQRLPVSHLRRRDRVLRGVIDAVGPLDISRWTSLRPKDPYGSLLRSIVGQQLSVSAATSIYERIKQRAGGRSPTPQQLLRMRATTLRACGLSYAKIDYVRDLARHVLEGDLDLDRLKRLDDERVREAITAVKGLGRWTADMFLIFHLRRPDVLPVGDLGLRRAVERAYTVTDPKPAELERIAEPWRPYRTMGSLYLWASLSASLAEPDPD